MRSIFLAVVTENAENVEKLLRRLVCLGQDLFYAEHKWL